MLKNEDDVSVTFDETKVKSWITLEFSKKINRFNFEEVLTIILKVFDDENVEFVGWFNGYKVVSIGGDNYLVIAGDNRIKLKLTKTQLVSDPAKREKLFNKYTKMLKNLKEKY